MCFIKQSYKEAMSQSTPDNGVFTPFSNLRLGLRLYRHQSVAIKTKITVMKTTKIIYWTSTILFSAFIALGAIFDAISAPDAVAFVTSLGYPAYIVPFLGVVKLLGIIAILVPRFPRLKEWAYAGLVIDLVGATYSLAAVGAPAAGLVFMILPIGLLAVSYIFYHRMRNYAVASALQQPAFV
jgi:hypothetical protein